MTLDLLGVLAVIATLGATIVLVALIREATRTWRDSDDDRP